MDTRPPAPEESYVAGLVGTAASGEQSAGSGTTHAADHTEGLRGAAESGVGFMGCICVGEKEGRREKEKKKKRGWINSEVQRL